MTFILCFNLDFELVFAEREMTTQQTFICSKLTIKTPKRRHRRRSGAFIVDFEHISHHFLLILLLTLNMYLFAGNEN